MLLPHMLPFSMTQASVTRFSFCQWCRTARGPSRRYIWTYLEACSLGTHSSVGAGATAASASVVWVFACFSGVPLDAAVALVIGIVLRVVMSRGGG